MYSLLWNPVSSESQFWKFLLLNSFLIFGNTFASVVVCGPFSRLLLWLLAAENIAHCTAPLGGIQQQVFFSSFRPAIEATHWFQGQQLLAAPSARWRVIFRKTKWKTIGFLSSQLFSGLVQYSQNGNCFCLPSSVDSRPVFIVYKPLCAGLTLL